MTPSAFGVDHLQTLLDAGSLRHKVIAQNVANVNTPGYKRLEVKFADELGRATGDAKPQVVEGVGPERVDGNTVDIDREMNDLTKNALLYQAVMQVLANRMSALRSAVAGR